MNLDLGMWIFVLLCSPLIILVILRALHLDRADAFKLGGLLTAWLLVAALMPIPRVGPLPGALFSILVPLAAFYAFVTLSAHARRIPPGVNCAGFC